MRSDYALYTVAIIFFILTGVIYFYQTNNRELYMVATAVIGLFFMGIGYTQRPRTETTATKTQTQQAEIATTTQITPKKEEKPSVAMRELTEIKGIGVKRAEQLKTLGIANVENLAKASAEDLASKLKISPKITKRWIEEAKKILEKT